MSAKIQTAARYVNRHSRRSTLAGTTEEVNGDGVSAWSGLSRDTDDYDSRWTLSGKAAAAPPPLSRCDRPDDKSQAHYDGDHSKNSTGHRHLARTMSRDHSSGIRGQNINNAPVRRRLRMITRIGPASRAGLTIVPFMPWHRPPVVSPPPPRPPAKFFLSHNVL